MEMSNSNSYTVIEEYTGASINRTCVQSTYTADTPAVSHIEPNESILDNPILYEETPMAEPTAEPMCDLYGEPLYTAKDDKMTTDDAPAGNATLALPAPAQESTPATTPAKPAIVGFSQEYKDSLQANADDTANTQLDNIELPEKDDPELVAFLDKLETAKPATTTYGSTYGGTYGSSYYGNGYYGSNYYNGYKNNYSSHGNTNNYDNDYYTSRQGKNWYSKYYDDDDGSYNYPTNKSRKVETTENKVTFSDDIYDNNAATTATNDAAKAADTGAENVDKDIEIKSLKEHNAIMLTKFSTMVKLFTKTLQSIGEVKKSQAELKRMMLQLSKDNKLMEHRVDYISRSIAHIRYAIDDETSDTTRGAHYGFDSDSDSEDDITKKGKFDNRVPQINNTTYL
ncbi:hypothetical protein F-S17_0398 [Faustovirus]|nr:hypothetical protein F-S17_0398 [Faustovirus]